MSFSLRGVAYSLAPVILFTAPGESQIDCNAGDFNAGTSSARADITPSHESEISTLRALEIGWDGNEAEPPNALAAGNATRLVQFLSQAGLPIRKISPDVAGGIGLYVASDDGARVAGLLCSNSGRIHISFQNFQDRSASADSFAWNTIGDHIKVILAFICDK